MTRNQRSRSAKCALRTRNSFPTSLGRLGGLTEPETEPETEPKWPIRVGNGGIPSRFNIARMLPAELGRPRYGGSPNFAELVCPRWRDMGLSVGFAGVAPKFWPYTRYAAETDSQLGGISGISRPSRYAVPATRGSQFGISCQSHGLGHPCRRDRINSDSPFHDVHVEGSKNL